MQRLQGCTLVNLTSSYRPRRQRSLAVTRVVRIFAVLQYQVDHHVYASKPPVQTDLSERWNVFLWTLTILFARLTRTWPRGTGSSNGFARVVRVTGQAAHLAWRLDWTGDHDFASVLRFRILD